MKRILSLIFALVMIACVFAGCGGSGDDGSAVTLKWALPFYEQTDTVEVVDKVNELLAEKLPNTKIELMLDSSMDSKWTLWMAGDKEIDIAFTGYMIDLLSEIEKKSYYPLDDLIEEYAPTIKAEKEKYVAQYATGAFGGKQYAIPNIQVYINDTASVLVPEEFLSYLDYKALVKEAYANPTTTEKMYEILDEYLFAAKESGKADGEFTSSFLNIVKLYNILPRRGYDFVGYSSNQPINVAYKVFPENGKLEFVDFYDTDEFKTFMKWARKWYNDGFICTDVLSGDNGYGTKIPLLSADKRDMLERTDEEIYLKTSMTGNGSFYCVSLQSDEQKFVSHSSVGELNAYCAIPCTSSNPERAMKFLELLRTQEGTEILNMLCYGIEEEHYEVLKDGSVRAFDYLQQGVSSSKYGIPNWMLGTHLNMKMVAPYDAATLERGKNYYDEVYPKFQRTSLAGLTFDTTGVVNEYNQINSVLEEYQMQLISGAVADYEKKYQEACTKMDAAGIDKILKEIQKQADEYAK